MIFSTTLFSALYGCIIAFVWSLALQFDMKNGLLYGGIIGGALGLIFAIYQKSIEYKIKQELRGMTRSIGTLFFMVLLVGVLTGLIAWLIRVIFF